MNSSVEAIKLIKSGLNEENSELVDIIIVTARLLGCECFASDIIENYYELIIIAEKKVTSLFFMKDEIPFKKVERRILLGNLSEPKSIHVEGDEGIKRALTATLHNIE